MPVPPHAGGGFDSPYEYSRWSGMPSYTWPYRSGNVFDQKSCTSSIADRMRSDVDAACAPDDTATVAAAPTITVATKALHRRSMLVILA